MKYIICFLLISQIAAKDYESIGSPNMPIYLQKLDKTANRHRYQRFDGILNLNKDMSEDDFTVPFIYYKSKVKGPRPFVIIPPNIYGVTVMEHYMARNLAKKGISAIIFKPRIIIQDTSRRLEEINGMFQIALFSLKSIIDWACLRESEFNCQKVATMGLSLGGILSSMILAEDHRIKSAYVVAAGADIPQIISTGQNKFFRKFRARRIKEENLSGIEEFEQKLRENFSMGIRQMVQENLSSKVFMVMAKKDKTVPYVNQTKLWKALGEPAYKITPIGHVGTILTVPFRMKGVRRFFHAHWQSE